MSLSAAGCKQGKQRCGGSPASRSGLIPDVVVRGCKKNNYIQDTPLIVLFIVVTQQVKYKESEEVCPQC